MERHDIAREEFEDLAEALQVVSGALDPLPLSRAGGQVAIAHSAKKLFHTIGTALLCKSGAEGLRETCGKALLVLFPYIDLASVPALQQLPSPSSVKRHMVSLEIALLMLERDTDKHESSLSRYNRPARYLMADSSPAWGMEWLWTQHHAVEGGDKLLAILTDSQEFIAGMQSWVNEQIQHDGEERLRDVHAVPGHLKAALAEICSAFSTHTYTPVMLASGFLGLSHELADVLYSQTYILLCLTEC